LCWFVRFSPKKRKKAPPQRGPRYNDDRQQASKKKKVAQVKSQAREEYSAVNMVRKAGGGADVLSRLEEKGRGASQGEREEQFDDGRRKLA